MVQLEARVRQRHRNLDVCHGVLPTSSQGRATHGPGRQCVRERSRDAGTQPALVPSRDEGSRPRMGCERRHTDRRWWQSGSRVAVWPRRATNSVPSRKSPNNFAVNVLVLARRLGIGGPAYHHTTHPHSVFAANSLHCICAAYLCMWTMTRARGKARTREQHRNRSSPVLRQEERVTARPAI